MTTKTLRHLLDFELETAGFTTGQIREIRRYLDKGTKNAHQRRLVQKYQQLRREIVAKEDLAAEKAAKRAERYSHEVFGPERLNEIPDPVIREKALKIAALWEYSDGGVVPFGGIVRGIDLHDPEKKENYYLHNATWNHTMPRMHASAGRYTQTLEKALRVTPKPGEYRFCGVTVRTAYSRIINGKDLFDWATA